MQLVSVLLIVVSVLGLLSGFFIILGAEKASRPFAIFFALYALVYALWTSSIINGSLVMANLNISVIFFVVTLLITVWSFVNMRIDKVTRMYKGWKLIALSFLILSDIAAVVYYLLALNGSTISWIAPLVVAPLFIITFYAVIRYRILQVSLRICKIWAYTDLSILCIIAYMCLFMLITQGLFHVVVSVEIIAINLLMIIIVTALFPIWSEVNIALTSLLSTSKVNLNYVVKMLNRFATQNVNLRKLAEFLADHLHFRYIGIVLDGEVYATKEIDFSDDDLAAISMCNADDKKIWMNLSGRTKELLEENNIVAVAELRNAKGRPFGQVLIGKPMGKLTFEKRDLNSLEMIINLVASIIDSKERLEEDGRSDA